MSPKKGWPVRSARPGQQFDLFASVRGSVVDSGATRPTPSGRSAVVWVLTKHGTSTTANGVVTGLPCAIPSRGGVVW